MPRISGFEELVLWNQPKSGLVLPVEFIPVADKDDLIILPPQCRSEKEDSLRPALPTATPSLRNSGIVEDLNSGRRTEAYPIRSTFLPGVTSTSCGLCASPPREQSEEKEACLDQC